MYGWERERELEGKSAGQSQCSSHSYCCPLLSFSAKLTVKIGAKLVKMNHFIVKSSIKRYFLIVCQFSELGALVVKRTKPAVS